MDDRENLFLLPMTIPVRVSPVLNLMLYLAGFGACIAVCISDLPVLITIALILFIGGTLFVLIYSSTHPGAQTPDALILQADDTWRVITRDGNNVPATLGKQSYVHQFLVILRFSYEDQQRFVILTADGVNKDVFRRLRVRLKHRLNQD